MSARSLNSFRNILNQIETFKTSSSHNGSSSTWGLPRAGHRSHRRRVTHRRRLPPPDRLWLAPWRGSHVAVQLHRYFGGVEEGLHGEHPAGRGAGAVGRARGWVAASGPGSRAGTLSLSRRHCWATSLPQPPAASCLQGRRNHPHLNAVVFSPVAKSRKNCGWLLMILAPRYGSRGFS